MKARDVMSKAVITVRPETPVREIAALMVDKRISGVPVQTKDGKLVGIVSQGDLLHRQEIGTEAATKWWLRVFADPDRMARDYAKAHGLKAVDVMTRHVATVSPDAALADVAAILDRRHIKRLPVVENSQLVGLITRTDLVKALADAPTAGKASADDATLQRTLTRKMAGERWLESSFINVSVTRGEVQLWGIVASPDQRRALRVLVEETPGVTSVKDGLTVGTPLMNAV